MKVSQFEDTQLEEIAKSNLDAFFSDMAAGSGQTELAKTSRDVREAQELDHFFQNFDDEMQLAACGRSGPTPRLRSEREPESDWRPGDDPEIGLEKDGGPLNKRYRSKLTKKVSASGWTTEFNDKGEIIRAYGPGVDLSVFEPVEA